MKYLHLSTLYEEHTLAWATVLYYCTILQHLGLTVCTVLFHRPSCKTFCSLHYSSTTVHHGSPFIHTQKCIALPNRIAIASRLWIPSVVFVILMISVYINNCFQAIWITLFVSFCVSESGIRPSESAHGRGCIWWYVECFSTIFTSPHAKIIIGYFL